MARGALTFRESDLTRALRATRKAGIAVQRVEIDNGKIIVVVGMPQSARANDDQRNEWDTVHG